MKNMIKVYFVYIFGCLLLASLTYANYRVGIDDVLKITIIGKQDYRLTEDLTVSSTGKILLSIMSQEQEVSGLTIDEIDKKLTTILADEYFVDPEVLVEVKDYRSHRVLVVGEVKSPGEIILQNEKIHLKDLLMKTGGPSGDMNKTVVVIKDQSKIGSEPYITSLDKVLMDQPESQVEIINADIVYVLSKDKKLPVGDSEHVVYVFGEVNEPGLIPYSKDLTTLRAVLNSGNFTKEAAPGRTVLKRREGEKIKAYPVNLDKVMSGGDKSEDLPVESGDVIYVPRAIF